MELNPQQKNIVESIEGSYLAAAVPGSGKTRCVSERVKYMISKGIDPSKILAITFTNKAANELRERIAKAVGQENASKVTASTFHSLCARILRENAQAAGYGPDFTICDEDDSDRLMKRSISIIEGDTYKANDRYWNAVKGYIEYRRNALVSHERAAHRYHLSGKMIDVVKQYFKELKKINGIDFTGLLYETVKLFKNNPQIRDMYRQRWQYISVDEFQDTNVAQYEMVKEIGLGHKNVLATGDLDQSIYGFRNASPQNLMEFQKDFGAKILPLEQNYRSTPEILKCAQRLIDRNKSRMKTTLRTENPSGVVPRVFGFTYDEDMAEAIATDIEEQIHKGVVPKEIAILYRVNYASRVLEKKLKDRRIQYKLLGDRSFFDRKEIKACIAILKLLCNDNDAIAFEKAMEFCCRGVGPKTVQVVVDMAENSKIHVMEAARKFTKCGGAPGRNLSPFVEAYNTVIPPWEALIQIAQATSFWDRMASESTDRNNRCANIDEMARDVRTFMETGSSLAHYLENLALMLEEDDDDDSDDFKVRLMTMHACKGLEFDVVYLSHCNQEIVPHKNALMLEDPAERMAQLEEERRLFYVAMTRAKKVLTMTFARVLGYKESYASQFLREAGFTVPEIFVPKQAQRRVPDVMD